MITNKQKKVKQNPQGSSLLSPAHGRAGQAFLPLLFFLLIRSRRRPKKSLGISSRRTKIPGGDDTQTPFLFARPSVQFLPREARPAAGGASEQTNCPQNSQCLDWSQLLNEVRTFFEQNPDCEF